MIVEASLQNDVWSKKGAIHQRGCPVPSFGELLPGDHEAEFLLFGFGSSLLVQCIGSAKFVTLYVVLATIQIVGQMLEPAEEEGGAEERRGVGRGVPGFGFRSFRI
jgi:hypothetical protein